VPYSQGAKRQIYVSFTEYEPAEGRPYFAIVTMDGDRLGEALGGEHLAPGSNLEQYQADVSAALSAFAASLRTSTAPLNLAALALPEPLQGATPPQLIYAGGEDVLFLADPRDALSCAIAVRGRYRQEMTARGLDTARLTISCAILYAHTKIPAGTLFAEAEFLLKEKAKREAGRDAVALSLHKRSGEPVSVAFQWDDPLLKSLAAMTRSVGEKSLSSRQTYRVAEEGGPLLNILPPDQWQPWLASRLSKGGASGEAAELLVPFFQRQRVEALRIARFLALETK
jgi:CRISPR/Cas system-associated protein Cas10 (large subunit of type III CRISPR-Cas system)